MTVAMKGIIALATATGIASAASSAPTRIVIKLDDFGTQAALFDRYADGVPVSQTDTYTLGGYSFTRTLSVNAIKRRPRWFEGPNTVYSGSPEYELTMNNGSGDNQTVTVLYNLASLGSTFSGLPVGVGFNVGNDCSFRKPMVVTALFNGVSPFRSQYCTPNGQFRAKFLPQAGVANTIQLTFSGADAWDGRATNLQLFETAIPEPATWAMLIAGFGMVGVAARRGPRTIKAA